jgi:hypothetical protein
MVVRDKAVPEKDSVTPFAASGWYNTLPPAVIVVEINEIPTLLKTKLNCLHT